MARRNTIRASDADRETVIERLRDAAAEGRLAAHELEHRVMAALRARTYGELDATVADLPTARLNRRRSAAGRTAAIVREHPIALVAVIPIVIVVVAAIIAIAAIAAVVMLIVLALGLRRGTRGRYLYGAYARGAIRRTRATRHNAVGGFTPWL